MIQQSEWVRVSALREFFERPDGQTIRRAVRKAGVATMKDDDGRLLIERSQVAAVGKEAVGLGLVRKTRS